MKFKNQIISPASGESWTVEYAISKLWVRSLLNQKVDVAITEKVRNPYFGDKDFDVIVEATTCSKWTDSPMVEVNIVYPIHKSVKGEYFNGFSTGIDNIPKKMDNYLITLSVTVHDTPDTERVETVVFSWAEMSEEDRKKLNEWIWWHITTMSQREFFS